MMVYIMTCTRGRMLGITDYVALGLAVVKALLHVGCIASCKTLTVSKCILYTERAW